MHKRRWLAWLVIMVTVALVAAPLTALADGAEATCEPSGETLTVYAPLGLNLRGEPTLSGAILAGLLDTETVTVVGCDTWADGILWRNVETYRGGVAVSGWSAAAWMTGYPGYTEPRDSYEGSSGCKVTANALRMRAAPTLEGAIVGVVPYGSILTAGEAEDVSADGYTWMNVNFGGASVWAAGKYLECFED